MKLYLLSVLVLLSGSASGCYRSASTSSLNGSYISSSDDLFSASSLERASFPLGASLSIGSDGVHHAASADRSFPEQVFVRSQDELAAALVNTNNVMGRNIVLLSAVTIRQPLRVVGTVQIDASSASLDFDSGGSLVILARDLTSRGSLSVGCAQSPFPQFDLTTATFLKLIGSITDLRISGQFPLHLVVASTEVTQIYDVLQAPSLIVIENQSPRWIDSDHALNLARVIDRQSARASWSTAVLAPRLAIPPGSSAQSLNAQDAAASCFNTLHDQPYESGFWNTNLATCDRGQWRQVFATFNNCRGDQ